jgi:peptide/nickel transport system permease protein
MRADFVRTARSKGLSGNRVLYRHIFANAITTLVTQLGMDLGYFLGGILVVEVVFAWPGIGLQAWQAIGHLDVPMIMGTVLFAAFCIAVLNLAVDLVYALLDPRVRLS